MGWNDTDGEYYRPEADSSKPNNHKGDTHVERL
jgi:hypothetical protein